MAIKQSVFEVDESKHLAPQRKTCWYESMKYHIKSHGLVIDARVGPMIIANAIYMAFRPPIPNVFLELSIDGAFCVIFCIELAANTVYSIQYTVSVPESFQGGGRGINRAVPGLVA